MNIKYEITDLFGGEANYAWVKRGELTLKERGKWGEPFASVERRIVRAVKKEIGWNGTRCRKENIGETIALYPVGSCTVCFID